MSAVMGNWEKYARTSSSRFAPNWCRTSQSNKNLPDKRRQALGQVCLLYDLQDHADIELLPADNARQRSCREDEVRSLSPNVSVTA